MRRPANTGDGVLIDNSNVEEVSITNSAIYGNNWNQPGSVSNGKFSGIRVTAGKNLSFLGNHFGNAPETGFQMYGLDASGDASASITFVGNVCADNAITCFSPTNSRYFNASANTDSRHGNPPTIMSGAVIVSEGLSAQQFKIGLNPVIPPIADGYHGSTGTKMQMSDGSGKGGNLVKFAADGSSTDSGTAILSGTTRSLGGSPLATHTCISETATVIGVQHGRGGQPRG